MARGKARVHELAKELGMTSKDVLTHLKEQGDFVKSASSTVEAPVARRLRERFASDQPQGEPRRRNSDEPAPRERADQQTFVIPSPRHRLTDTQVADLCRAYRKAYADKDYEAAIARVLTKYQELYQMRRSVLHHILTEDKRRNLGAYTALRLSRNAEQSGPARKSSPAEARDAENKPPGDIVTPPEIPTPEPRPRTRRAGLPPAPEGGHLDAIADIAVAKETSRDRDRIVADLAPFDPTGTDRYGYLGWRYATSRRHPTDPAARTPRDELAAIAHIVDSAKQRLQQIHNATGQVLEHPNLARRALESGFGDLFDPDLAADERHRVMNKRGFLQRAIILACVDPQCADRLWDMLDQLQPAPQPQLFDTTPQLRTAIEGLTGELAEVEALLSSDETTLGRFFDLSKAELADLLSGRFDYLQQFRDAGTAPTTRVIHGLAFSVLPQGEHLRTFLDDLRRTKRYDGHHLDERRLTVLEELQDHFVAHRCLWHKGSATSSGVDNRYLILSITSATSPDEDAVAISPMAGEHATYVVRHECVDVHWSRIFELPKEQARERGARRLYFRSTEADQYTDMRDKVIALLECDPGEFSRMRNIE